MAHRIYYDAPHSENGTPVRMDTRRPLPPRAMTAPDALKN